MKGGVYLFLLLMLISKLNLNPSYLSLNNLHKNTSKNLKNKSTNKFNIEHTMNLRCFELNGSNRQTFL